MICPLCGRRKPKRACPALNRHICTVCCGTKRLVEISCPDSCVYLSTAKMHPPAVVQRQQDQDRALLLPLVNGLSERQARVLFLFAAAIARHQAEPFQKLLDSDVALAAGALAATVETSLRGIVYEQRAGTLPADRLLGELHGLLSEMRKESGSALDRDSAVALRRLESAAHDQAKSQPESLAFQQLLARLLPPTADAGLKPQGAGLQGSSLSLEP